jgi:protein SCO1/2
MLAAAAMLAPFAPAATAAAAAGASATAGASVNTGLAPAAPPPARPAGPAAGTPHFPFGVVQPVRPIPAFRVRTHLGLPADLATLLRGQITAVQLMFTGCSAICPIQGALFAQLQAALRQRGLPVQLLSLSIDPLGDSPAALAAWLRQFGAGPGWLAVAPEVVDVARLTALLGSGGEDPRQSADVHSGQVFVVNRRAAMSYRTATMPAVEPFTDTLARIVKET